MDSLFVLALSGIVRADSESWLGNCQFYNWYARSVSGHGTGVAGTMDQVSTPSTWSVDQSKNSTWDQAAWLVSDTNINQALEVGLYSGYFPYDGSWTNGMLPYYTYNNGATGGRYGSPDYIPSDVLASIGAEANAQGSFVWNYVFLTNYAVYDAVNMAQGEVTQSTATYMGNGTGYANEGYWLPGGSSTWYPWGFETTCANSPYWIDAYNSNHWTAGGY
jgi:hypothetical protein